MTNRSEIKGFSLGVITTAAIIGYYAHIHGLLTTDRASSLPSPPPESSSPKPSTSPTTFSTTSSDVNPKPLSPEFREEQLSRNTLFFGEVGMNKIRNSTVVVVGLGGVGSHCAHLVARSGVERLVLIDFDQVTLSSTNRHATATLKDVGTPKVTAVKRFLAQVCPNCEVFDLNEMFTKDSASRLLDKFGKVDFIVDAIDDLPTKAFLIKSCVDRDIPFVSSMGAACKADPTRMHIGDIRSATKDPLSTKLRWHLRKLKVDIDHPLIKILYSSEKVTAQLAPLTKEQQAEPKEFGTVDNMRLRVLPVLGTMPAIMGQAIASYVLCELGQKPFSPTAAERLGKSVRHRMLQHIKGREEKIKKEIVEGTAPSSTVAGVEVDTDDIEYMMCQVWRNRCLITGDRLGSGLELIKWDDSKPASVSNLVLMSGKGWTKFKDLGGKQGVWKEMPEVAKEIEKRLDAAVEP